MTTTYTIPTRVLLLRDWEDFGEKDLPVYFEKAYSIFLRRMEVMRRLDRPLNKQEEKELRFMLDALVEAKHAMSVIPARKP